MPRCQARLAQHLVGFLAAQVGGNIVAEQRIGRSDRLRVAAHLLDLLRSRAALPQADQPQAGDTPAPQVVQLHVGHLVQPGEGALVFARELVQPDVYILRHQHQVGHPIQVLAEALRLIFVLGTYKFQHPGRTGASHAKYRSLFFADQVQAAQQAPEDPGYDLSPTPADVIQLRRQRIRVSQGGSPQHRDQVLVFWTEFRLCLEESIQLGEDLSISSVPLQGTIIE